MNTVTRSNGIFITLPDSLHLEAPQPSTGDARRKDPLPRGPVPLSTEQAQMDSDEQAALLEALRTQDFTLLGSFDLVPAPATIDRLRRSAGPIGGSEVAELQVELGTGEEAVILAMQEGYYTWCFPDHREELPVAPARQGERGVPARRVTFRIKAQPMPVPHSGQARRGVIGDFLFERVKTLVLKFAAEIIAQQGMEYLERHVHKGLVVMTPGDPKAWRRIEDLKALPLPTDRPARLLLFVHGTFSSTVGSFHALAQTPWGKTLLQSAQEHYDAVIGFDHPTLSVDPRENATDLLTRLRCLDSPHAPHFDVVCFSRGGLVYRSLAEYLLPAPGWSAKFDRIIFVASPNGGTQLAEPDNWHTLLDLYTNLAVGATRAIGMITQTSPAATIVAAFVKYLATHVVTEGGVPGLAAMKPDSEFMQTINRAQPGQIIPEHAHYYAIISSFKARLIGGEHLPKELPLRLVLALADRLIDKLMDADNDLVVDRLSIMSIDTPVVKFIKDELNFPENPDIYHTNYFTRPEMLDIIARWLHLLSPSLALAAACEYESGSVIAVPWCEKHRKYDSLKRKPILGMDWDQVKGNWKKLKGQAKQKWGKLTDDDWDIIEGNRDELVGKLQERYDATREEANRGVGAADPMAELPQPPSAFTTRIGKSLSINSTRKSRRVGWAVDKIRRGSLFDQLIPEKLQRLLWRHRKDFDSIMVISTEPFIPWELVHLKDPDKTQLPSETLFLAQLGLVRWLHGSWPPNKIRKNRTRYVIPNYPNAKYALPQTQEEKKFLEQKLHGRAVEPQPLAVQTLLREPGSFDLLHFACHGGAEDGNIMHAKLMMEGRVENGRYIPAHLSATMVEQFASLQGTDGARPMIVLNACQAGRIGFKLTGLGGFAQAFHKAGAGAFIGPLWSVGDLSSAHLYRSIVYRVAKRKESRASG